MSKLEEHVMVNKVLLADDSATIQKLVEMALSDSDFELLAVSDGKQAVDKLGAFQPDIILADAIMPALNGYEVCAHVKGNPDYAHIPVILLTGRFQPYDKEEAERAGVDEKIVKPFSQDQLVSIMTSAIEAARENAPAGSSADSAGSPEAAPAKADEPGEMPAFDEGATIQASPEQLRASLSVGEADDVPEIDAFSLEGDEPDDEPMELHTADFEELDEAATDPAARADDELELADEDMLDAEDDAPSRGNFEETLSLSPKPFGSGDEETAGEPEPEPEEEPEPDRGAEPVDAIEVEELELTDEDLGDDEDLEETLVVSDDDTQPSLGEDTEPNLNEAAASLAAGEPDEPEPAEEDRAEDELVFTDDDEMEAEPVEPAGSEDSDPPVVNEADTVELDESEMEEIREAAQSAELTGDDFDLELDEGDALPDIGDETEAALEVEEIEEPLLGDVVESLDDDAVEPAGDDKEPEPLAENPDFEVLDEPAEPEGDMLEEESVLEDVIEDAEPEPLIEDDAEEPLLEIEDSDSFIEEPARAAPAQAAEPPAPEPSPVEAPAARAEPVESAPEPEPEQTASFADTVQEVAGPISLSDEQMDALAGKVASHLVASVGSDFMRDVIWQVVPELAEAMIKKRIYQLEQSVEDS